MPGFPIGNVYLVADRPPGIRCQRRDEARNVQKVLEFMSSPAADCCDASSQNALKREKQRGEQHTLPAAHEKLESWDTFGEENAGRIFPVGLRSQFFAAQYSWTFRETRNVCCRVAATFLEAPSHCLTP